MFRSRISASKSPLPSSSLEALEARIAPAAIVSNLVDADGDLITIKTSKGTNADLMAAIATNTFDGSVAGGVQINTIDLANNPVFAGTDLSVTARPGPLGGNGLVDVNSINASGLDLGTVMVKGDLKSIVAGVAGGSIASISVNSFSGTSVCTIHGSLGALNVATDLRGVEFHLDDMGATLGVLKVGHSVIGESANHTGFLSVANGTIKTVTIGGDIQGGGTPSFTGVITARTITKATVGGSMIGGSGMDSGEIDVTASLGSLLVKGDVIGGTALDSGFIHSSGTLGNITINGSLLGGAAGPSGSIEAISNIGNVKIGRDLQGGGAAKTGAIETTIGGIASVTIGGSVIGGTASSSGRISSTGDNVGPIKIGGDLRATTRDSMGNLLQDTGSIFVQAEGDSDVPKRNIASLTIGGSVIGGRNNAEFQVTADGTIGPVKIGHDIRGGAGSASGAIAGLNGIASLSVGGSLIGGAGIQSGSVNATTGLLGSVSIGGSVIGGSNLLSGEIAAGANAGAIAIGGDLVAGSALVSGIISVTGSAGAIKIGGSIDGTNTHNAIIEVSSAAGLPNSVKSLTVGGRVEFATINIGGITNPDAQMGAVKVGGDWIASTLVVGVGSGTDGLFGTADDVALSDGNAAIFSKIASITIGGRVDGFLGGADHFGFVSQEIGALTIDGVKVALNKGHGNDTDLSVPRYTLGTTTSTINNVTARDTTVHEVL